MAKMAQTDKRFCLSHSVLQELYNIRLWFLIHMQGFPLWVCTLALLPSCYYFWSTPPPPQPAPPHPSHQSRFSLHGAPLTKKWSPQTWKRVPLIEKWSPLPEIDFYKKSEKLQAVIDSCVWLKKQHSKKMADIPRKRDLLT